MSPSVALHVLTWAALVLLFFGLAAVLREVRLLRGLVLRNPDGYRAAEPDLVLGNGFASGGAARVVLAADSGCPLCQALADRLAGIAPGSVLLTHEPADAWAAVGPGLVVVSDREAWRAVAHLAPPVLMLVDGAGRVLRMNLPVRVEDADAVLGEWHALVEKENTGGSDVRAHS